MKIKKFLVGAFAVLAALSLSACSGNKKSSSSTNEPKELNVEFVPSTQANKMEAKAKPLGTLLQKQLHIPVHVTVSTDFSGLVEAMSSKKVDVGFMPPYSYMLAHKRGIADVLLQAERYGYDEPSGKMNHKLMHKYRGMIVVKKGSKIKSWKDLKGKKIAIGDPTSSSGYVYPIAELYKKGLNVTKDSKLVNITSDDQRVISVLNGDVDAAFVFSDARDIAAKDDKRAMTDVVPIYFTQWIPNDTISVRKDMPKKFRVKLAKAFKNIAKSKKGKQIIESIYSHYGYVDAKDSDFDVLRNYQKIVNEATGK
ncbi:phosphate/phosphite/phosphonate ABC transporter substrate-binding protein [Lactobacillus helveticus]|uniref:phosphate/phosphite/phosphonate ABC transporter substrate-binding protein n=1 Tax=Lactobacillus helveticus TaxID=1587 RepID=UPI00062A8A14|nr:phosphate/phosphite/phosphonate ABC transporter substrate-binding protein [Lactobacillus helveticus]AKG65931.1 phosphate ABC transporter substrate-binding protein [Lactobacillus helveticus]